MKTTTATTREGKREKWQEWMDRNSSQKFQPPFFLFLLLFLRSQLEGVIQVSPNSVFDNKKISFMVETPLPRVQCVYPYAHLNARGRIEGWLGFPFPLLAAAAANPSIERGRRRRGLDPC